MTPEELNQLLQKGENIRVEFKEATSSMPSSLFDTVASFLNKEGGTLILGVEDDGTIKGIDPTRIEQIRKDIVTASNNPAMLNPPFTLSVGDIEINGKRLLYIGLPVSSQVHTHKEIIYDRENDSNLRVTDGNRISEIYFRKRQLFTESQIYPALRLQDLNPDLFRKARAIIRSLRPDHPWLEQDDLGFMRRAMLYRRDLQTGQEGFTLAAALLFGTDEVIGSILPAYKVEALVRRENQDRWDDRLTLRTNLIDSYGLLMDFIRKHLPDKFFLEGNQRKDLREIIFREVIGNIIVHREYTNALHTELVIYQNRVEATNPNRSIFRGPLLPDTFSPFAKNPTIRKVFTEFGWTDEIGSGIRNVNKYLQFYAEGAHPQFIEDDTFKTLLPLTSSVLSAKDADLLLKFIGLSPDQIQHIPIEELAGLPIKPEINKNSSLDQILYGLSTSWYEKGTKLEKIRLLIDNRLSYDDFQKVPSLVEKGTKLLPKRSRMVLTILLFLIRPIAMDEIMHIVGYANRKSFRELYIDPLRESALIQRTIPDKPNDPNQQYVLTEKGKLFLGGFEI